MPSGIKTRTRWRSSCRDHTTYSYALLQLRSPPFLVWDGNLTSDKPKEKAWTPTPTTTTTGVAPAKTSKNQIQTHHNNLYISSFRHTHTRITSKHSSIVKLNALQSNKWFAPRSLPYISIFSSEPTLYLSNDSQRTPPVFFLLLRIVIILSRH